jgi:hypothetical protein
MFYDSVCPTWFALRSGYPTTFIQQQNTLHCAFFLHSSAVFARAAADFVEESFGGSISPMRKHHDDIRCPALSTVLVFASIVMQMWLIHADDGSLGRKLGSVMTENAEECMDVTVACITTVSNEVGSANPNRPADIAKTSQLLHKGASRLEVRFACDQPWPESSSTSQRQGRISVESLRFSPLIGTFGCEIGRLMRVASPRTLLCSVSGQFSLIADFQVCVHLVSHAAHVSAS